VADAPVLDGAALAKAWLVELVAVSPLEHAARLPGPRFAEDAPRLCAAAGAALASDAAFDELEPGGSLAPLAAGAGHLVAAAGPLDAVTALEALRAVAWSELQRLLDRPDPAEVAHLADRLAAVVATITAAVLDTPRPSGPPRPGDRGPLAAVLRRPDPAAPPDDDPPPAADSPAPAAGRPGTRGEEPPPADRPPIREEGPPPAGPPPTREEEPPPAGPPPTREEESPPADPSPPTEPLADARPDDPPPPRTDVSAHLRSLEATLREAAASGDPLARLRELADAAATSPPPDPFSAAAERLRGSAGPVIEDGTDFHAARIAPWTAAIDRRLARHRQDGLPFAVLCVEIADLDRLAAAEVDDEVGEALEAAEGAVCAQLRPADVLVRERAGRYWLTAPDTDPAEARTLAHRIAAAIAAAPAHRRVPLQAAIGVAACPADATETPALEGRADEGVFAARAAGVRVAGPLG